MKLSDYVADFLADIGSHVYGVCGAGAMHLNDSICNHPRIKFIATHHEQAAAMAAEAETRITGKIGLVHVTAGPGGTNTITGVAGAWVDSIPMMVISGQVGTKSLKKRSTLRQLGTNELGLVDIVHSITKYAITVTDPLSIRYHLERAFYLATSQRNGPVWIEIPLDVQCSEIDPDSLDGMQEDERLHVGMETYLRGSAKRVAEFLNKAQRPLIWAGNGVHLSGAAADLRDFVNDLCIPVVSSWNASDIFETGHPLYVGRPGIMGDRAGNFAVQNADLILAIGTRLSVPQIGHSAELFAPNAKLITVDIDAREADKPTLRVEYPVVCDALAFIHAMWNEIKYVTRHEDDPWPSKCREWKYRYPVMLPEYRANPKGVNSYFFMDELAKQMGNDAVIVTDVGAAFISAMQSLKLNGRQRMFHSGGVSAMGWGIPAAIGACLGSGRERTICLVGDGGAMLNIQELQTIFHHNLPITIFVFENGGYLTMQYTQNNHFKREAASSRKSGMSCPNFTSLAHCFGLDANQIWQQDNVPVAIKYALNASGPHLCVVHMPENQLLQPRVQSKMQDGKWAPVSLEDMWPYLPADEVAKNMAVAC